MTENEKTNGRRALGARLGLAVPGGWWPTAPMLKSYEAAGFGWVQVHTPPRVMLTDKRAAVRHARALRAALDVTGLRLVVHGPDDLSAGAPDHDRAFDGLVAYADAAGAAFVVYHGMNFPVARNDREAERLHERLCAEERSLRLRVPALAAAGTVLAIENLAPVYPGRPPRISHAPTLVRELVRRLRSPHVGLLFDVGHAAIVGGLRGADPARMLAAVADDVVLFHLHDNLGARTAGDAAPGIDPLRLDLHLAPGAGRLRWDALAPVLLDHRAPLVLEVAPPHRPEPLSLAEVTAGLLRRRRAPLAAEAA